ncbi:MAG: hypothetical protein RIS70_256 [Planctomycetota bacterium]
MASRHQRLSPPEREDIVTFRGDPDKLGGRQTALALWLKRVAARYTRPLPENQKKMMAKSNKNKPKEKRTRAAEPIRSDSPPKDRDMRKDAESRVADAITVAWMLTVVATLVAELIAVISWFIVIQVGPEELPRGIVLLPIVMWATSVVTGSLDLGLALLTSRLRTVPAPKPILVTSIVIGMLPLAALILLAK